MKKYLVIMWVFAMLISGCSSEEVEEYNKIMNGEPEFTRRATGNTTDVKMTSVVFESNKAIIKFESREDIIAAGEGLSSNLYRETPQTLFDLKQGLFQSIFGIDETSAQVFLTPQTEEVVLWFELENGQCVEVKLDFPQKSCKKTPWPTYFNVLTTPNPDAARLVRPLLGEIHALMTDRRRAIQSDTSLAIPSILPLLREKKGKGGNKEEVNKGVITEVLLALPAEYIQYDENGPQVLAFLTRETYHRTSNEAAIRIVSTTTTTRDSRGNVISVDTEYHKPPKKRIYTETRYSSWDLYDAASLGKMIDQKKPKMSQGGVFSNSLNASFLVELVNEYWAKHH